MANSVLIGRKGIEKKLPSQFQQLSSNNFAPYR